MRSREWLDTTLRFVEQHLPAPPSTVFEIGCGGAGGFVPALTERGYAATGIDPAAPDGPLYRQIPFEQFRPPARAAAIVACTSLHHVHDVDEVVDHIDAALAPGGTIIVLEWAWERFDEATARWCFERLVPARSEDERTWLHRHRENWQESGTTWDRYLTEWTHEHGLHRSDTIIDALAARFDTRLTAEAPYLFSELAQTSEADEERAIAEGRIRATGVKHVATSAVEG